jgi:outer membrane protein TolC
MTSAHAQTAGDGAPAQGPLSLDSAMNEAMIRSPDIQRAKAAVEEVSWKKTETFGGGFLPRLSVSGLHYFETKYTQTGLNFGGGASIFPGFYPNTELAVDLTIPVFNGLASVNQLQAASLSEDAARNDLTRAEFQLSEEVKLAFFQALAADELKAVAQQNVTTLEDHLKQVKIQRQVGAATNYDTLRVEVQLNEARADAIDAEDNVTLARKRLTQLLGLSVDQRPLQGSLPLPEPEKVKGLELTAEVPEGRTDIQAMNLRSEAAGHLESASGRWIVPSLSVGGQYLVYDSQFVSNTVTNTGVYKTAYNVGVFLKWNVFDGGVSYAQAKEAGYRAIQAEKAAEASKLQVPYDFTYWKRRYLSNSDHYLSKKFDIVRSEESVRLAKEEERAGTRTSTEVLDAELDLYRAKAGVVNAQVKAVEAKVRLELALGRRI